MGLFVSKAKCDELSWHHQHDDPRYYWGSSQNSKGCKVDGGMLINDEIVVRYRSLSWMTA